MVRPEGLRNWVEPGDKQVKGDLGWADGIAFGTPTRFGNVAAQLKAFLATAGPLWIRGALAGKVYSAFTASNTAHGGQEFAYLPCLNDSQDGMRVIRHIVERELQGWL